MTKSRDGIDARGAQRGNRSGHHTFVFARDRTEPEILEAVRAGRTVVYDRGRAYGDPELIELASTGGLDTGVPELPAPGVVRLFSRLTAVFGLAALLLFSRW